MMNTDYFVEMVEKDIENLLSMPLWEDVDFVKRFFKQKQGNDVSFYKRVILQSKEQREHWGKVAMFVYRFGRFINITVIQSFG
ncbi:hypothetical protein [Lactococcus lactis]|uniref:hypothetical protein n=1 Tax=Lactococcus lactis TaxID=1358 RepID=UPI00288CB448|nr:hypothetical protein [Lactococcus lactis]MDT2940386.1 hypothetical protein [Lactococcus lactis]